MVEIGTVRQQVATNNAASPVGQEERAAQVGSYRGQHVRSVSDNSKLGGVNQSAPKDVGSLISKGTKQSRVPNQQAVAARLAEWHDKLPDIPDFGSIDSLMEMMQQLAEELPAMLSHSASSLHEALEKAQEKESSKGEKLEEDEDESEEVATSQNQQGAQSDGQKDRRMETTILRDLDVFQPDVDGSQGIFQVPMQRVFAALQEFDGDVTHQFAALDILRDHFASAGADEQFLTLLDRTAATFQQGDLARDVRAGMAVAKIAHDSAQTLQTDPAAVRETYRSMLREQRNIGQLFDSLSSFDLSKSFAAVVDMFRSAAGQDMASTGPSTDTHFLGHLLTELSNLKKMQTTFEGSQDLILKTDRLLPPRERGLTTPEEVTSRVLNFASKPTVGLSDARGLLGGMEKASPEGQVVFANGLRALHGDLPDEIIPTSQARLQQVTAILSLLNNLVSLEEAHHASNQKRPPN